MSKFENPESENDFLADDDYLIDEDLRELESQLAADASFLHATYPSSSSKSERLTKLITACVSASKFNEAEACDKGESPEVFAATSEQREITPPTRSMSNDGHTLAAWKNFGLGIVASACLVICVVWYFPQEPNSGDGGVAESATTVQDVDTAFTVTPVSMSLPAEFLNATQPELEAIYDNMCPECDYSSDYLDQFRHMDF